MSSMSVGRLSAMICIAVGLSIGLMKTLFPNVYDLIGSSCLVLVGMSLLAVCIIFCAIPYMQCCHSPPKKIEIVPTPKIHKELHSDNHPPIYEESALEFDSESDTSSIGKASIIDGESVTVEFSVTEKSLDQVKISPASFTPMPSVEIDIEMTELRRM